LTDIFNDFKLQLSNGLKNEAQIENSALSSFLKINEQCLLIKGDVSGIQDFIFNVKSEGAAKSLKARSFFVHALGEICIQKIKDEITNTFELFNAGGNFYLLISADEESKITQIQTILTTAFVNHTLYISLSWVKFSKNDVANFGQKRAEIEAVNAQNKLKRYHDSTNAFEPTAVPKDVISWQGKDSWEDFTKELTNHDSYEIKKTNTNPSSKNQLVVLGYTFKIGDDLPHKFNDETHYLAKTLPRWNHDLREQYKDLPKEEDNESRHDGTVISFHQLAAFAELRTGTNKLGVVKMDVDNLGKIFGAIQNLNNLLAVSKALKYFFEGYLTELLKRTFIDTNGNQHRYSDNVYIVFAGGDDSFLVGGWDVVLEFSILLRQELKIFSRTNDNKELLRLSGGMVMVPPKYPVVRFSEEADDAEKTAKTQRDDQKDFFENPLKDNFSLFGFVVRWEEMSEVVNLKNHLLDLILKQGEPKSFLHLLTENLNRFENTLKQAIKGRLYIKTSTDLEYQLARNMKRTDLLDKKIVPLINKALKEAFLEKKIDTLITILVATHWAELLLRNSKTHNK
jgi:CRISPR-associated protein Csm1